MEPRAIGFDRKAAAVFEYAAAIFLALTMLLSIADVVLRSIDPQWRIFGVVEMVQLTFDCLVFLAIPAVFVLRANIVVNLFDELLPRRMLRLIVTVGAMGGLVYMALLGSQAVVTGLDAIRFNDETQDLRIPLVTYWVPIWIGVAGALLGEAIALIKNTPPGSGGSAD